MDVHTDIVLDCKVFPGINTTSVFSVTKKKKFYKHAFLVTDSHLMENLKMALLNKEKSLMFLKTLGFVIFVKRKTTDKRHKNPSKP